MKPIEITCKSCVNFYAFECHLGVPNVTEDSNVCLEYLGDPVILARDLPYEMTIDRPPEVGSVVVLQGGKCVQIAEVTLIIKTVEGEVLDLSDVIGWRTLRKFF